MQSAAPISQIRMLFLRGVARRRFEKNVAMICTPHLNGPNGRVRQPTTKRDQEQKEGPGGLFRADYTLKNLPGPVSGAQNHAV